MEKSRFIWVLDPGHGGLINGVYQTAGKRSPIWEDGTQYFEGVGNRILVKKLLTKCIASNIRAIDIVDSEKDVPLNTRVVRANQIYHKEGGRVIYVSIHSDGVSNETANGYSVYTSFGQTKSDLIAEVFLSKLEAEFPNRKLRSDITDGDRDKEADLAVCRDTLGPSILVENFFMTNRDECKNILMKEEGQDRIVRALFNAILDIEKNGIR